MPHPGLAEAAFEDIHVPLGLVDDADLAGAAFEIIVHPEGAGDNIDDDYDDLADFTRAFEAPPSSRCPKKTQGLHRYIKMHL